MPVIVHDREAHGDTLDILKQSKPKGVVHCFSGSKEMAQEVIRLGMYIGLNGVATFKNARKSIEVAKAIPIERLVLETDCSYIAYIAERLAPELNVSAQELLNITNENARRLYNM